MGPPLMRPQAQTLLAGLGAIHGLVWIFGAVATRPLAQKLSKAVQQPGDLASQDADILVDLVTSGASPWPPHHLTLGWIASFFLACLARAILIEVSRPELHSPPLAQLWNVPIGWVLGRMALGLAILGVWLLGQALDSAGWLPATQTGLGAIAVCAIGALAWGRSVDTWLALSLRWQSETKIQFWRAITIRPVLRDALFLALGSVLVTLVRLGLFLLFLNSSTRAPQTAAFSAGLVAHGTLFFTLAAEALWYVGAWHLHPSSRERAAGPSTSPR